MVTRPASVPASGATTSLVEVRHARPTGEVRPRWQRVVKRSIDLAVGVVALLLVLPVMLVAAMSVRLSDGGPVLFRQVRIGRDGRPFTMVKFRSMVPGAEHQVIDLRDRNQREGPLFKLARDPRVTPVGRLLRVTSIDELPQLFNVIAGHMSIVGPRPAMPAEVAWFDDELQERHLVRPGITGLWQIAGRDDPSFSLYRHLDLFYVRHWSVVLDLAILVVTAQTVVVRALCALRPRSRRVPRDGVLD